MNENKQVAANYVINFYNDIVQLNNFVAMYINLKAELKHKYATEENLKQMSDDDKNNFNTAMQNIRFHVSRVYIQYQSLFKNNKIKTKLKDELNQEIELIYKNCKDNFIIKLEELEKITIVLNGLIVDEVISSLLMTSQEFFNTTYATEQKPGS